MRKLILASLFVSVVFITAAACQGMVITLDENGHGYADGTRLDYGVDTPPVGNWATLYYVLPFTRVVEGDVGVLEPPYYYETDLSDVLRFINVNYQPRVYVYSDVGDMDLADTGIPALWTSPENAPVYVNEVGYEGYNYANYTPAGQTDVTYHFISDVPEPATLMLLGLGGLAFRKHQR